MSLPPLWSPLESSKRAILNDKVELFNAQYYQYANARSAALASAALALSAAKPKEIIPAPEKITAKIPAPEEITAEIPAPEEIPVATPAPEEITPAKQSVDIELLRILKAGGATDDDLLLIGATMIANK